MKKDTLPPDPEKMNDKRAEWGASCIRHFQCTTGTDYDDALCDLLCDLMHWADRNELEFDGQLSRARMHYEAETSPCIEILVDALNEIVSGGITIAAGGVTKARMVQIATDALECAPTARAKIDDEEINF